jgi:hypothetical protein
MILFGSIRPLAWIPEDLSLSWRKTSGEQSKMEFDLRTSRRREPRGFDEQWAANAAETEKWRSVHVALPTGHDRRPRQGPVREAPRTRNEKGAHAWFTVVAGGLTVGGLIVYLLLTLADIGPPKELPRATDLRTKEAPLDARRVSSPGGSAAPKTTR